MVEKDSKFTGAAVNISSIQGVQTIYAYLKKTYADKSHVVCAYKLMDQQDPYANDCEDDKDIGADRCLLKVLRRRGILQ